MQALTIDSLRTSVADDGQADDRTFPLVLTCNGQCETLGDAVQWVAANRDALDAAAAQYGAVLFRGFPLRTAEDFDAFITGFGYANFPYAKSLSNAVRVVRTERVFSANEAPPEVTIYLHHEMAQTPIYPQKIFFFCEVAPEAGGATPLCRSDALFKKLHEELPEFVEQCAAKGLRYTNVMPTDDDRQSGMGRSWQSTLGADSREKAEGRLRELGYSWRWLQDGCLQATTPTLPAVRRSASGRLVFFNQLIAAFKGWKDSRNDPAKSITFGDGLPLDPADVTRAADIAESLSVDVQWQVGDAVLVDNTLAMHARRSFTGKRRVLASLASAATQRFDS